MKRTPDISDNDLPVKHPPGKLQNAVCRIADLQSQLSSAIRKGLLDAVHDNGEVLNTKTLTDKEMMRLVQEPNGPSGMVAVPLSSFAFESIQRKPTDFGHINFWTIIESDTKIPNSTRGFE